MKQWKCVLPAACIAFLLVGALLAQTSNARTSKSSSTVEPVTGKRASPSRVSQTADVDILSPEQMREASRRMGAMDKSIDLARQGDADATLGNWRQAKACYQRSLASWPDDSFALYGMGQCAANAGDITDAIGYYRTAIYTNDPNQSSDGYRENDGARLMEYVLLLSEGGQTQEAMTIYRRATHVINYLDGHQNVDVLLPNFRPGEWAYTPQRLRAMAHIGIALAHPGFNDRLALSHLQKAIALAPNSPLPFFYRGQCEDKWLGHPKKAKADYEYARQFGNAEVEAWVEKAKANRPFLR